MNTQNHNNNYVCGKRGRKYIGEEKKKKIIITKCNYVL